MNKKAWIVFENEEGAYYIAEDDIRNFQLLEDKTAYIYFFDSDKVVDLKVENLKRIFFYDKEEMTEIELLNKE